MSEFSFSKAEKLKSRKAISLLFEKGRNAYSFPVKILYHSKKAEFDTKNPVKCGVSVSSKKFRKAVDRNLLKRRMREAYRLNKKDLMEVAFTKNLELNLFIIYLAKEKEDFFRIQQGMISALEQVIEDLSRKE
ncbi:MAG: ribonuclease P protein component [Bacteroidales bacterium]